MSSIIRIGFIGAGANSRLMHLPKLQEISGVRLHSICNRSEDSSLAILQEFGFSKMAANWREVCLDPEIDAIVIGTWPDMHERITLCALENGKHVLCEARMARNASEAGNMLRAAQQHPELISQVVPSPFTFKYDNDIQKLIKRGFLGKILAVRGKFNSETFLEHDSEMNFRTNGEISGYNTLFMGIFYESMARWLGHAKSVMANSQSWTSFRLWEEKNKAVEVPEHVDIIGELNCGAQYNLQFSSITGLDPEPQFIRIYGSEGSLWLDLKEGELLCAKNGGHHWKEIDTEEDSSSQWRVEEEFIAAIRGEEEIKLTDFETAYRYMEFTEAVARSSAQGKKIFLPLGLN